MIKCPDCASTNIHEKVCDWCGGDGEEWDEDEEEYIECTDCDGSGYDEDVWECHECGTEFYE